MIFSGIDLDMEPSDPETCLKRTRKIAEGFRCPTHTPSDMLDCLRKLSAENIINYTHQVRYVGILTSGSNIIGVK